MMRRGFWLLAGAVIGVTGYRKASRLARSFTGRQAPARSSVGSARTALALPGRASARPAARHASRSSAMRVASAVSFVKDIRDGMAEYHDLHREERDRTLESRSDRTMSGDSEQSTR